eukprot:tig00021326_g20312.t1
MAPHATPAEGLLLAPTPIAPIVDSLARAVCGPLTRFSYVEGWAVEEHTGALRCARAVHASQLPPGPEADPAPPEDPAVAAFRRAAEGAELRAGADIVARAAAAGRPEWLVDCGACPPETFARAGPACPFRALFVLPILRPARSDAAAGGGFCCFCFFSPAALEYDSVVEEFVRVAAAVALYAANLLCPALPPPAPSRPAALPLDPCALDLLRVPPGTRSGASLDYIDRSLADQVGLLRRFPSLRRGFLESARLATFPAAHRLCGLGEPLENAFVLLRGTVRCTDRPATGSAPPWEWWTVGAGEGLGEACLLRAGAASAVEAICESEVACLAIPAPEAPRPGPGPAPVPATAAEACGAVLQRRGSAASLASCRRAPAPAPPRPSPHGLARPR